MSINRTEYLARTTYISHFFVQELQLRKILSFIEDILKVFENCTIQTSGLGKVAVPIPPPTGGAVTARSILVPVPGQAQVVSF